MIRQLRGLEVLGEEHSDFGQRLYRGRLLVAEVKVDVAVRNLLEDSFGDDAEVTKFCALLQHPVPVCSCLYFLLKCAVLFVL